MEELKFLIIQVKNIIDETAVLFYQQKKQEGFQSLDATLSSLMQTIDAIQSYQTTNHEEILDIRSFNSKMTKAMEAMQHNDTVLLADILYYDINHMLAETLLRV